MKFLFDSTKQTTIMKCGHTMHVECYNEMYNQNQYVWHLCLFSPLISESVGSFLSWFSKNNLLNCISLIFYRYRCPICSKSVLNMSSAWERLDQEVLCNIPFLLCSCMHILLLLYSYFMAKNAFLVRANMKDLDSGSSTSIDFMESC